MTERIDHAAVALKVTDQTLSYGSYGEDTGAIVSMIAAQVHATLALVEQKRAANIIAATQVAGDALSHDKLGWLREALGL